MKSYKFRIYPSKSQCKTIALWLGICRNLYNSALEERRNFYTRFGTSRTYVDQAACLPEIKDILPECNSVHSQILQTCLKRLDLAYQNFFRRVKRGETPGFPRFKSYDRYNSFTYPQSGFRIDGNRIFLSKIGYVPIVQHREIEGKIKTCSVIRTVTGKYFVCLTAEAEVKPTITEIKNPIGIDLGIKQYVTLSDGTVFNNTVPSIDKKLAKLQQKKELAAKKSARRADLKLWIAKLYEKNCNRKTDFQHKLSRKIVNSYDFIAMEDLNIVSMQAEGLHGLNKRIDDAAWNRLIQMVSYKAEEAGKICILVDPANTSQTCSHCGHINVKKLTLKDRVFICENDGHTENRDINSAQNVLIRGLEDYKKSSKPSIKGTRGLEDFQKKSSKPKKRLGTQSRAAKPRSPCF